MKKRVLLTLLITIVSVIPLLAAPTILNEELTTLTDSSIVITWQTTDEASNSVIEYGIGALNNTYTSSESVTDHYLELTGLSPNTTYLYRIKSGSTYGDQKSFTTLSRPTGDFLFSFATMTDPFYAEGAVDSTGAAAIPYSKSAEMLTKLVNKINGLTPSFTVIKGNIIKRDYGDQADTEVKNKLDLLTGNDLYGDGFNYFPIPGEEDKEGTYGAGEDWITGNLGPLTNSRVTDDATTDSSFNSSFNYRGYHFILLDSVKSDGNGSVDTTWLENDLSSNTSRKAFIFMHHPPYDISSDVPAGFSSDEVSGVEIDNSSAFETIISNYSDQVAGVFYGHIHDNYYRDDRVSGVPFVRTASPLQYPAGFNLYKVYSNGYTQSFYKIETTLSEYGREIITAEVSFIEDALESFWLGSLSHRNFTHTYTILDNNAPSVSLTSPSDGATVSDTISLTATATDEMLLSSVKFYLDEALLITDTASPFAFSLNTNSYSNGTHTLEARATDIAGNLSTSEVIVSISNSNPTMRVTSPDGGETLTGNTTYTISWEAAAGVGGSLTSTPITIYYSTDEGVTYPETIASSISNTGTYEWTVPNTLNVSTVRIKIEVIDTLSRMSTDESNANFTIKPEDNTPPIPSFVALSERNSTSDKTPTITGIATDEINTVLSIECRVDGGSWESATAIDGSFNSASESFYFTVGSTLTLGEHYIDVRATDSKYNLTSAESYVRYTFSVTAAKPTVTITYIDSKSVLAGDSISATPSIEATISSGKVIDNSSIKIVIDNTTTITSGIYIASSGATTTISYQLTTALSEGYHRFRVNATDIDGGVGTDEVSTLLVKNDDGLELRSDPLNYPNPFDPANDTLTYISYDLSKDASITLRIFDLMGSLVYKRDLEGTAGYNETSWNGKNESGETVGNGIYVFLFIANNKVIGKGKIAVFFR